jgi:FO synthase subunit 1
MVREIPLLERLPIYPQYIHKGWYSEKLKELIETLSDEDGYRKTLSV